MTDAAIGQIERLIRETDAELQDARHSTEAEKINRAYGLGVCDGLRRALREIQALHLRDADEAGEELG